MPSPLLPPGTEASGWRQGVQGCRGAGAKSLGRMGWGSVEGVSVGVHAFESRGRQKLR